MYRRGGVGQAGQTDYHEYTTRMASKSSIVAAIQRNPSIPDTLGTVSSVLIKGMCPHIRGVLIV